VVRNYWADRERRALPPVATDSGLGAAEFNRMTNVIELADLA
jgi:hypothetical protein